MCVVAETVGNTSCAISITIDEIVLLAFLAHALFSLNTSLVKGYIVIFTSVFS